MYEKIKEPRQNFQNILAGRRSGSAKISDWYYEDLLQIWAGSPCVHALSFGTSTSNIIVAYKQVQVLVVVVVVVVVVVGVVVVGVVVVVVVEVLSWKILCHRTSPK